MQEDNYRSRGVSEEEIRAQRHEKAVLLWMSWKHGKLAASMRAG